MTATTMAVDLAPRRVPWRVLVATVAGNAIEFYDFLCFSFFATYIAAAFFPGGDEFTGLLKALAVFWSGFLFRPLGGVVIGAFADRAGRRPAMLLTIGLITIGTMGLALTPSYETIGVAGPILLILCRAIQGFALGGEVGPASVFLVEAAPPGRRGFYASWQIASQGLAVLAAGVLGVTMALALTKEQLGAWGWRVPFVLCLALIPLAAFLRSDMPETLGRRTAATPREQGLGSNVGYIALGVLVIIGSTVSTYVGNYMATYAMSTLQLSATVGLSATFIGGFTMFVCALIGGWLGDRYGRKALVLWPRVALTIVIWPLFLLLAASPNVVTLWLATIVIYGLTALSTGISLVILPELLPKRIRATGLSICYAIGVSIFGGSTPLVVTWLIKVSGNPAAPAWYVIVTSLITIAATLALPETRDRVVD